MQRLSDHLTRPTSRFRQAVHVSRLMFVLVMVALPINPVVALPLGLSLLTALLLFSAHPNPRRQFVLCMIGLGLMLTALVVVVLKGDVSRMNTVFKFYLQVWVLWAVAAAAVLPQILAWLRREPRLIRSRTPEPPEGSAWTPEIAADNERWRRQPTGIWVGRWWGRAFVALLVACLLYPLTATPARAAFLEESKCRRMFSSPTLARNSA